MNVALLFFACMMLASCSFIDSYLVGKTRDPYWAHRPVVGRSNNYRRTTPIQRRYSNYNNNYNQLNNRFSNSIDNHMTEMKLKRFFPGDDRKYGYPFYKRDSTKAVEIMNRVKMPKLPPMPKNTRNAMNMRDWPEYIPPISMIKLPLDEPPAAIN